MRACLLLGLYGLGLVAGTKPDSRFAFVIIRDPHGHKNAAVEFRIPRGYGFGQSAAPEVRNGILLRIDCHQFLSAFAPDTSRGIHHPDCDYPLQPAGEGKYLWSLDVENRMSFPLNLNKFAALERGFNQPYIIRELGGKAVSPFTSGYMYSNKGSNGRVAMYERRASNGSVDAVLRCSLDTPNPACQETFEVSSSSHVTVHYQFPMRAISDWPRFRRAITTLVTQFYVGRVVEPD